MRAALVQMRSGPDPERNAAHLADAVADAASRGARYVQTPEMTGMLDADRSRLMARARAQADDPFVRRASEVAGRHGVWLHVGSTTVLAETSGRLANRAMLFAPDGTLRATYDKLHLFDVDIEDATGSERWRESDVYAAGKRAVACDLTFADEEPARLGLAICYDLRFPSLFADLARAGASVLTAPSAFTARTGRAHWEVLTRARAIECGAYLLAAAQGGRHEDGRETWGRSVAVDPWGEVVGMLDHDEPDVLVVDVDPARSARARAMIPNLRHARSYALDVVAHAKEISVELERAS